MGLAGGMVAMVRQQDVLLFLLPDGIALTSRPQIIRILERSGLFLLGFVATFCMQMLVWWTLRGSLLAYSYTGFHFSYLLEPRIFPVLFSSNHGLITWHPVVAICLVGLFVMQPKDHHTGIFAFLCFLGELYVVASWWNWWKGYSFGNRAFLGLTPLFILGLASLLQRWQSCKRRKVLLIGLALLSLWNALLMLACLSNMLPREGEFSWIDFISRLPELPYRVFQVISNL